MEPFKVLVCGGRDFNNEEFVFQTLYYLNQWFPSETMLIEGGARGADRLARKWAHKEGYPCITVNAPWDDMGSSAGAIRNRWMLEYCKPDLVVALPGGAGTAHMVKISKQANIAIYEANV